MMKVDSVKFVLLAKDMSRAVDFYRDVMGLAVKQQAEGWSELSHRDLTLALQGGGDGAHRPTCLSFEVSDLETACREVRARGGAVIKSPARRPGQPVAFAEVRDPEGNGFTMSQYVGF